MTPWCVWSQVRGSGRFGRFLRGRKVDGVGKDREMRCLIGMADDSAAGAVLDAV
jgi:hypothetical protein